MINTNAALERRLIFSTQPDRSHGVFCGQPAGIVRPFQKQKMKMILNDKQDCIELVIRVLERTSAWRRGISARFPDDPRNMQAAAGLDKLAADAVNLTDAQWQDLKLHFSSWASEIFRDALNQTAKSMGFRYRAKSFSFFVEVLLTNLPSVSVAA